jgi:hypothetical protein
VVDALQQLKSTADGELRRILEISVPKYTGATKTEIDAVFGKLSDNYGLAGPIFIQFVVSNIDTVRDSCLRMQAQIDKGEGSPAIFARMQELRDKVDAVAKGVEPIAQADELFSGAKARGEGFAAGENVTIEIIRDGERKNIAVTLGAFTG